MPQSLSGAYIHLVFSTKDRRPLPRDKPTRKALHSYLGGVSKQLDCPPNSAMWLTPAPTVCLANRGQAHGWNFGKAEPKPPQPPKRGALAEAAMSQLKARLFRPSQTKNASGV